jgi:riboflavin transporter FmnP
MEEDRVRQSRALFARFFVVSPWRSQSARVFSKTTKECIFMSEPNASAVSSASVRSRTHKITVTAMLSAIAFLLMFVEFSIPTLIPSFVKMDISDLPELLAAFSLGPVYGVAVAFLKNLLHIVFKGTSSAYVGELCNFLLGSVFALAAGFIYQWKKSRKTALIGSIVGAALMALVSVPLNYFIVYPAYVVCYGMPMDAIIGMYQALLPSADSLLKCLTIFNLPFTFCKGLLDVLICFLVYKPLSPLLHK